MRVPNSPAYAQGTEARPLVDPDHCEGLSTQEVARLTLFGRRVRLQLAGLSSASRNSLVTTSDRDVIGRRIHDCVRL